jgi:hypothetical protein
MPVMPNPESSCEAATLPDSYLRNAQCAKLLLSPPPHSLG